MRPFDQEPDDHHHDNETAKENNKDVEPVAPWMLTVHHR
jgi:hypothetical protein